MSAGVYLIKLQSWTRGSRCGALQLFRIAYCRVGVVWTFEGLHFFTCIFFQSPPKSRYPTSTQSSSRMHHPLESVAHALKPRELPRAAAPIPDNAVQRCLWPKNLTLLTRVQLQMEMLQVLPFREPRFSSSYELVWLSLRCYLFLGFSDRSSPLKGNI